MVAKFDKAQGVTNAQVEAVGLSQTLDYLHREAALGKREEFERFLHAVPDAAPVAGDEIKPG